MALQETKMLEHPAAVADEDNRKVMDFIAREILSSIDYDEYVNIFGKDDGMLLPQEINEKKTYRVNSLNFCNYAFYECLLNDHIYEKFLPIVKKEHMWYQALYREYDNGGYSQYGLNNLLGSKYRYYMDIYHEKIEVPIEEAGAIFAFTHRMTGFKDISYQIFYDIDDIEYVVKLENRICNWSVPDNFTALRNNFQKAKVHLTNSEALDFVATLKNSDRLVMYIEMPDVFYSKYNEKKYDWNDAAALLESIRRKNSKRKFLYHCIIFWDKKIDWMQKDFFAYVTNPWNDSGENLWATYAFCRNNSDYVDTLQHLIVTNFPVSIAKKCCLNKTVEHHGHSETETKNDVEYEIVTVPLQDYWNQFVL